MADLWYYGRGEERWGPFSARQLKHLADTGQIVPTDTVWKEGVEKGVPAARVQYLFDVAAPSASSAAPVSAPAVAVADAPASVEVAGLVPDTAPAAETIASAEPTPPPGAEQAPGKSATTPAPGSQQRKGRAVALKGAIIVGQDGTAVQYRKKCTRCGHEDNSKSRMPIRQGTTRLNYFCPKCRKLSPVEIQGIM